MKDAMTYASEAGFFSFNVVGWRAEFERLIEAVRADVLAEQPSQEYQDHLANQSFDWSAMSAKHQFMEGYRIGLAEMREKCATVVTEHAPTCSPHWVSYVEAIRAINFEGDTGFRPVSELIAEHEPFDMNDHPPHRLCECRKCMEYFTPLSDCDAYEQPVSQEPVIPAFLRRPGSFGD